MCFHCWFRVRLDTVLCKENQVIGTVVDVKRTAPVSRPGAVPSVCLYALALAYVLLPAPCMPGVRSP